MYKHEHMPKFILEDMAIMIKTRPNGLCPSIEDQVINMIYETSAQ